MRIGTSCWCIPTGLKNRETLSWMAVWANSPEEAKAHYKAHYRGDGPIDEFEPWCRPAKYPHSSSPWSPHEETNYEVLRQIGWREPGDRECEACGLCSLGMYPVCHTCYRCTECGHQKDCEGGVHPDVEV